MFFYLEWGGKGRVHHLQGEAGFGRKGKGGNERLNRLISLASHETGSSPEREGRRGGLGQDCNVEQEKKESGNDACCFPRGDFDPNGNPHPLFLYLIGQGGGKGEAWSAKGDLT